MITCPACAAPNPESARTCFQCQAIFVVVPSTGRPMADDPGMRLLLPVGRTPLSIVAGYLGLLSLLLVPAPAALITGILAVRQLHNNPGKHGMGRAVFGIVMGALGTVALAGFLVG